MINDLTLPIIELSLITSQVGVMLIVVQNVILVMDW